MNGIELIKKARAVLRFTPILTLTTESQQGMRAEGKNAGATGWLVKPVSGSDLLKVIKQVLPGA
jgi:two-component system chemotaxis response regulator CheY